MDAVSLNVSSFSFTEEEFFQFCQQNDNLRFERTADHQIIVMAPTGSETSFKNSHLISALVVWNAYSKLGYVFESNAGFTLPNGAMRSPDASWILKERYDALTQHDRERFSHICPDFVIELKSTSDDLKYLKDKMEEWIANGCRLGWLICPKEQKAFVYKPNSPIVEVTTLDSKLSGEEVLRGFELDLSILK